MTRLIAAAILLGASLHPAVAEDETLDDLLTMGQPIYEARCAECHSKSGAGFIGPSFHDNDRLATDAFVLRQINNGGSDMPAFGKRLTPEEIVAVGTYIRNSWGNAYGVLRAETE